MYVESKYFSHLCKNIIDYISLITMTNPEVERINYKTELGGTKLTVTFTRTVKDDYTDCRLTVSEQTPTDNNAKHSLDLDLLNLFGLGDPKIKLTFNTESALVKKLATSSNCCILTPDYNFIHLLWRILVVDVNWSANFANRDYMTRKFRRVLSGESVLVLEGLNRSGDNPTPYLGIFKMGEDICYLPIFIQQDEIGAVDISEIATDLELDFNTSLKELIDNETSFFARAHFKDVDPKLDADDHWLASDLAADIINWNSFDAINKHITVKGNGAKEFIKKANYDEVEKYFTSIVDLDLIKMNLTEDGFIINISSPTLDRDSVQLPINIKG